MQLETLMQKHLSVGMEKKMISVIGQSRQDIIM